MAALPTEILAWMAAWQGRFPPRFEHPRIVIYAADHGVGGAEGDTRAAIDALREGRAPVCALAEKHDADLRLYELNLAAPTADFTTIAAMTEAECAGVIVYGMMAVEMGVDALALCGFGRGASLSAAVLAGLMGHEDVAAALLSPQDQPIMDKAVALHADAASDPLELLRRVGGREMAAMLGVMIAARMARTPVVLEGVNALVAAALLHRLDDRALRHCLFAGNGTAAATRLAESLELSHVDGEAESAAAIGTASAALFPLLRAASVVAA